MRLKTVVPLDDEAMDRVEMTVAKYQPLFISRPKKTIIQRQPIEFPAYQNAEVFIADFTFAMPVAPSVLRDDIRKTLGAADEAVYVRNDAEPGELEMEHLNALADIDAEATKKKLKPVARLDDPGYHEIDEVEHADMYGNEYNAAFLSYLARVRKEQEDRSVHAANAPFRWLDIRREPIIPRRDDYNANIVGAPKVAPEDVDRSTDTRHSLGHFMLANGKQVRRMYVDDEGNRVVLARDVARDDKQP